jgi:transcriptional regulator with XRE-family HTH domain
MPRQDGSQPALGRAIRAQRTERELSQAALAERAGLTVAALSRIERGHTNPTWGTIVALAKALHTTVANLAARSETI